MGFVAARTAFFLFSAVLWRMAGGTEDLFSTLIRLTHMTINEKYCKVLSRIVGVPQQPREQHDDDDEDDKKWLVVAETRGFSSIWGHFFHYRCMKLLK